MTFLELYKAVAGTGAASPKIGRPGADFETKWGGSASLLRYRSNTICIPFCSGAHLFNEQLKPAQIHCNHNLQRSMARLCHFRTRPST